MANLWYIRNTNIVELDELHDDENDVYLDGSATVQLSMQKNGVDVAGHPWPLTMTYIGANGKFRGKPSNNLVLLDRDEVDITVTVSLGGAIGEWSETVPVRERGDH